MGPNGATFEEMAVASLMEDESLNSFVVRSCLLQTVVPPNRYLHLLAGTQGRTRWDTWGGCQRFLDGLPSDHPLKAKGDPFRDLTSLAYFEYFSDITAKKTLSQVATGRMAWARNGTVGLPTRFGTQRPRAACPQCAKDDIELHGFTWWRRSHQIPGVSVCHVHEVPLVSGCAQCGVWTGKPAWLVMPFQPCGCARFEPLFTMASVWSEAQGASRFARECAALLRLRTGLPQDMHVAVLRRRAMELYGEHERINGTRVASDLRSHFGSAYVGANTTARWGRLDCQDWVERILLGRYEHCSVEHYVMLSSLLFGSIEAFHSSAAIMVEEGLEPCSRPSRVILTMPDENGQFVQKYAPMTVRVRKGKTPLGGGTTDISDPVQVWTRKGHRCASKDLQAAVRRMYAKGSTIEHIMKHHDVTHPMFHRIVDANPALESVRKDALLQLEIARCRKIVMKSRCTRSVLWHKKGCVMRILSRHDAAWLRDHLDKHRPAQKTGKAIVNWVKVDGDYAREVAAIFKNELEDSVGRPRRITNGLIQKILGARVRRLRHNGHTMTHEAIQVRLESERSFRLRKLVWILRCIGDGTLRENASRQLRRSGIPKNELAAYLWLAGGPAIKAED